MLELLRLLEFRATKNLNKTTWICKTPMKFIFKFYNFCERKGLDDLKKVLAIS